MAILSLAAGPESPFSAFKTVPRDFRPARLAACCVLRPSRRRHSLSSSGEGGTVGALEGSGGVWPEPWLISQPAAAAVCPSNSLFARSSTTL